MSENTITCPYCNKNIDYTTIMGDSDWDDQGNEPYKTECPHCGNEIEIQQWDVEIIRYFDSEKI